MNRRAGESSYTPSTDTNGFVSLDPPVPGQRGSIADNDVVPPAPPSAKPYTGVK
jgi:hypothetical protein